MLNYIVADLKRIAQKKSIWIALLFFVGLYATITQLSQMRGASANSGDSIIGYSSIFSLFLGIPIFLSVYADDMKAGAMQVAIGFGLSREKVILAKIIETAILTTIVALLSAVLMLGIALLQINNLAEFSISGIFGVYSLRGLTVLAYTVLLLPILYLTQNYVVGNTLYILLATGVPASLLSFVLSFKMIKVFVSDGSKYLLTNVIETQINSLTNQTSIPVYTWLTLTFYLVGATSLAILIFRKRELEL